MTRGEKVGMETVRVGLGAVPLVNVSCALSVGWWVEVRSGV